MNWQERCADIADFMEANMPGTTYRIVLHKQHGSWMISVEGVRADNGPHSGSSITWVAVRSQCVDELPILLMDKCKERVKEYVESQVKELQSKLNDVYKARGELDRRTEIYAGLEAVK